QEREKLVLRTAKDPCQMTGHVCIAGQKTTIGHADRIGNPLTVPGEVTLDLWPAYPRPLPDATPPSPPARASRSPAGRRVRGPSGRPTRHAARIRPWGGPSPLRRFRSAVRVGWSRSRRAETFPQTVAVVTDGGAPQPRRRGRDQGTVEG